MVVVVVILLVVINDIAIIGNQHLSTIIFVLNSSEEVIVLRIFLVKTLGLWEA